MTVFSTDKLTV